VVECETRNTKGETRSVLPVCEKELRYEEARWVGWPVDGELAVGTVVRKIAARAE